MMSPFVPQTLERVTRRLEDRMTLEPPPCGPEERMPVFLLGFPRSGTTLLEQILISHPQVQSFGEHTALSNTCIDFYMNEDGIDRLAALDEVGASVRRAAYWREVAQFGTFQEGAVLLDKLPLNSVFLPAIAKIFPRARILFALRDPRDVVLSCFQQRFGMNTAMYQLRSLESAARYYDLVMKLAMAARERGSFELREVRYEDVVADLEGEARATLAFMSLEWDPAVMTYREEARERFIRTPSVAQVVEPLYTRAQGKWRNYETHLAPVRPILDEWAARFGYG
jgi:hypothetical protein